MWTYQGGRNTAVKGRLGLLGGSRSLDVFELLGGVRMNGRHGGEASIERNEKGKGEARE